jgi:hypothetical protein
MVKVYLFKKKLYTRRLKSNFKKKIRRQENKARLIAGYEKFMDDVRLVNPKEKVIKTAFHTVRRNSKLLKKPEYSEAINYFKNTKDAFSKENIEFKNNIFLIPKVFSLIDNYVETSVFLRKFFNALYNQSFARIFLDYKDCSQIDVGASVCMDIILSDFIKYYEENLKGRHNVKVEQVVPINFDSYNIKKILFSIGAFKTIRGFKIDFDNIIPFPIIVGNNKNPNISSNREVDITKTVDYIISSLAVMNKTLTAGAETDLYKVIGEVIQNADEHSDTNRRYSIGYFESTKSKNGNYGVFNLAILNFGNTIYETFKSPNCLNKDVVAQMEELSKVYTQKSLFKKAEFEEESLWTLYALQDGITRKQDWKRGNGSIRFIESFFKLKGNDKCDNVSKMVITSGNTRVIFNGKYSMVERPRGKEGKLFKMMTFNEQGNIEDLPDPKFVKYERNYFPGTLISVKIRIDYENTENI